MNEPLAWRPSHRRSEETGKILDRAFDDDGVPVPTVDPDVYRPFGPSQLMAMRICIGEERGKTLEQCAVEVGCSTQNLSSMVKTYRACLRDGFKMRGKTKKLLGLG